MPHAPAYTANVRRTLLVLTLLAAASLCAVPSRAAVPAGELLDRLAAYVLTFQTDFSRIIGTEHYMQVAHDLNWKVRTREMQSDIFFVGTGDDSGAMTVRSVRRVDGRSLPDASLGIDQALALPPSRRLERLKALADLGARYNLGTLQRNFNDPTLPLMLAALIQQSRFRYTIEGAATVDGHAVTRLAFREVARPTVIRGRDGVSVPAMGRLWVDDGGTVWRTELRAATHDRDTLVDATAVIRVGYGRDAKLGIMVPVSMDEDYRYGDQARVMFVGGHASYDGYRRFETSARVVP
jgi:hypothetical protein